MSVPHGRVRLLLATEHTEITEGSVEDVRVMQEREPPLLYQELTGVIRQTAFETHRYFGPGFLERVYENSLVNRLRKKGLDVKPRHALAVRDEDGTVVGDYEADLLVSDCVVVELKAAKALAREHVAQLLNYLKASRMRLGILINFGAPKLDFRRFVNGFDPSVTSASSVAENSPLQGQQP